MNTKYVNELSVLAVMMIQKNQEISLALKAHKPNEVITELKEELVAIHKRIKLARQKINGQANRDHGNI